MQGQSGAVHGSFAASIPAAPVSPLVSAGVVGYYLPYAFGVVLVFIVLMIFFELRSFATGRNLQRFRNRFKRGLASALLYRKAVNDEVIKLSTGAYLAMIEVSADDPSHYSDASMAATERSIAKAFGMIGGDCVVHAYEDHFPISEYHRAPDGYRTPILAWLDDQRASYFEADKTFTGKRYVSIAWLPQGASRQRLISKMSMGAPDDSVAEEDALVEQFESRIAQVVSSLRQHATVRRMGSHSFYDKSGRRRDYSELLSIISWTITGKHVRLSMPLPGQHLNGVLAESYRGGFDIELAGQQVRIIAVKGFPSETRPQIFARMADLQISYSFVLRWLPLDGSVAAKALNATDTDWKAKQKESVSREDSYAGDMRASNAAAVRYLKNGGVFGMATPMFILRSTDKKAVDMAAREVISMLAELTFKGERAKLTAEDLFFASLPGDGYHGVYKYALNDVNAVHLASMHEESMGREYADDSKIARDVPALAYAVAAGSETMYRINLNDEPRDVYNAMFIGGIGSGKSVTLGSLAASWIARMPHAGFTGVDRGRSLYRLTRFVGGNFYDILGERAPAFAVFSGIENDDIFRECIDEISIMLQLQGVTMTPDRDDALLRAVELLRDKPKSLRNMSALFNIIQDPDGAMRPAIRAYTSKGYLGAVFDATQDTFDTSFFNVIEVEKFINLPDKWSIPLYRVMFWKSRSQVRELKRRTGNYDINWMYGLDEVKHLLQNPLGASFVSGLLKLGRKDREYALLMGNAAADFADSKILNDITAQIRTRFLFANTDVRDSDEVRQKYRNLGISDGTIDALPHIPKHHMLLQQPSSGESAIIGLRLDDAWSAIVGRTSERLNRNVDAMIERYPDTWRIELLRSERVTNEKVMDLAERLTIAQRDGIPITMNDVGSMFEPKSEGLLTV